MRTQLALSGVAQNWKDYLELTKPKVVALITFTAMVGMLLARPDMVPWPVLLFGTVGIALVASAAAAINHMVDRHVDASMKRTRGRPLPTGSLSLGRAVWFAGALCLMGMTLLIVFVNPLTAVLTFASLIGYAVIYTMFLKRATPQNIVIGGAAGAAPPLLGWTAVSGQIEAGALLLFLIIFVWTPPHFWALAIHRRAEYAKVDIPMLPVTHGVAHTRLQILLYTILLLAVSVLPFVIGMSGWLYFLAALVLGGRFLWFALRLYRSTDNAPAMPMFVYSIAYLFALFGVLMLDHYLLILLS